MAGVRRIVIPYAPRRQFLPFHTRTQRWAAIVAHRRAGKTVACVNDLIRDAVTCALPHGRFAYVAPFLAQAKEVAWDYLKRYALPVTEDKNESELWVQVLGGHRIRIHGADNPDRLRGSYLDGALLDEYADMRPSVWGEVIRPMLADRRGRGTFIGTPKGRNEFWRIVENAKRNPDDWYFANLPASETGILPREELDDARKDMTPEQYEQEFECSFEAAILGAYFGKEIAQAERDGRITRVPYNPNSAVYAAWDLGKGANMAVWLFQVIGREIHVIAFHEGAHSDGIPQVLKALGDKGYPIKWHWVPHDARATEIGSGLTRIETMVRLGMTPMLVPDHKVMDGINAARMTLPAVYFDRDACEAGLEALRQYAAEFDEKMRAFKDNPRPIHWSNHAADAFRYLCMAHREMQPEGPKPLTAEQKATLRAKNDQNPQGLRGLEHVTVNELMRISKPKGRARI